MVGECYIIVSLTFLRVVKTTNVVASLATLSGVTYMIGVLESFEKITMENWSDVDSASGIVLCHKSNSFT